MMLEVENLSPFTRAFHIDGKEYIFRANQVRIDIPSGFLNQNGTMKFAGLLKLRRIIDENGDSTRVYIRKSPDYQNPNQEWEYIFEKDGVKTVTINVTQFCIQNGLNPTSIRSYIKSQKPYKGWNISKKRLKKDEDLLEEPGEDEIDLEEVEGVLDESD